MGSSMVIGILLILSLISIVPSSAQDDSCWTDIGPCLETAKAQNYPKELVVLCCPSITNAVNFNLPCFCSIKPDIVSQGATAYFDSFFVICNIPGTFDSVCPDAPPTTPSVTPSAPAEAPEAPTEDPLGPSEAPSVL